MGGDVDFHEQGIEIGTTNIELSTAAADDILFNGLPAVFQGHVCHSQTVTRLPENTVHLAKNDFEPNHAFRIGSFAWGVQFHPEYDEDIMRAYAENMTEAIDKAGLEQNKIIRAVRKTPYALKVLNRFGRLCLDQKG